MLGNLPSGEINPKSTYVLGVDFGRTRDETALVVLEQTPFAIPGDSLYVVYIETNQGKPLTHAIGRIKYLDSKFHFKKIYLDSTGLGTGPSDILKEDLKGRVEGINFTLNSKAEMFTNLKLLFQQGKLHIPQQDNTAPNTKKLIYQLLSIQCEYTSGGIPKLSHPDNGHDDTVCALCLAALYFKPGRKSARGYGFAGGGQGI